MVPGPATCPGETGGNMFKFLILVIVIFIFRLVPELLKLAK